MEMSTVSTPRIIAAGAIGEETYRDALRLAPGEAGS
jgi:hypothetical protein